MSSQAQIDMAPRSASLDRRVRSDDSWVEISSQPSSSSLSSTNDDIVTSGLRVQYDAGSRRRRTLRPGAPSRLNISHLAASGGGTSSQEEYDESESESDRVMASSGEGIQLPGYEGPSRVGTQTQRSSALYGAAQNSDDGEDKNRTAINYPVKNENCFTPQPNAFSHPPSSEQLRSATCVPEAGSYFPAIRQTSRLTGRHSIPSQPRHLPQNILSPSCNVAAQHDEALRASLSTLLSCAAAARGLPKSGTTKVPGTAATVPPSRNKRVEPSSLRLISESQLPTVTTSPPQFQEPTFQPTIRRSSTSTSSSSTQHKDTKRKAVNSGRSVSRERRTLKKARRSNSTDEFYVAPTLLTWVLSAGVVVFLSALSFRAGYSMGKEAGRIEASGYNIDDPLRGCAREASRSTLGLKRSLARSAVQV
ncbi:hypothetical protein M433DRAFT_145482 [Acidomyces richmondensis BFW]|nr:MAG: hypothetical protein FE78DRAFT_33917 [Acidomyces sp. 'richmondensis']KYG43816.1 hypothetical protein M433DRAFT_145482 [Acidomyces richmondensis BFW]